MSERLADTLRDARARHGTALVAYLCAGYPTRDGFADLLREVSTVADAVEIGVPFSDPMADGVTIQRASRAALDNGTTLRWIVETLQGMDPPAAAPLLLMSYLNPLLAFGLADLAAAIAPCGVEGLIVPDLPLEESAPIAEKVAPLGLVQMVTPATPATRQQALCAASHGFVYAVTITGITGGAVEIPADLQTHLAQLRDRSPLPVLAGFGIRTAEQVRAVRDHADGVIVGSALIDSISQGDDPTTFLRSLRPHAERTS